MSECRCAIVAATAGFATTSASAQQYPANDLHFICAFPPGSGADVLVRYFAEKVRPLTGKNIIVENKVGAGGTIAHGICRRAPSRTATTCSFTPAAALPPA